jgi:hypothetical protein
MALLIGAQTGGLTGVENDVDAMANALKKHEFDPVLLTGARADRAGIIAAYEQLIAAAAPDDAVVVYFSGHGGLLAPPHSEEPGPAPMDMQFIVPADYRDSTENDFRGILSVELSVLLARLTDRTRNVVVALDCCHAAHMSRDPDLRVKALAHQPTYEMLRAHLERLRGQGLAVDRRSVDGNEHAVRIVACAPEQAAYEYNNDRGVRTGMLTEALTLALAEADGLQVTWATVMDRVRRRVLAFVPNQRPEAEGPSSRLLFATEEAEPLAALPAISTAEPGRIRIDGARLLGVQPGDEFMIMPAGAPGPEGATKLAVATVVGLGPIEALADLGDSPAPTRLPLGARAYRTKAVAPAVPVRVPRTDPRAADLVAAMSASTFVRLAGPDDPDDRWLAEVLLDDAGRFTIHDRVGPLSGPHPPGDPAPVLRDLERLARAVAVRALTEDPRWSHAHPVTVEWGRVDRSRPSPLGPDGAVVYAGDRIYVRLRNDSQETVYASLVDVGVSGKIAVITRSSPGGVTLAPGNEFAYGYDDLGLVWTGRTVMWPAGLDPMRARPETILVLTSSQPADVSVLDQDGVLGAKGGPRTPLRDAVEQLVGFTDRDLEPDTGDAATYAVRRITFDLGGSRRPPADEGAFLIDQRPDPSMRVLAPKGPAERTVAVRLAELRVHRNRAMFGADIRVDAVVLTGGGEATKPVYRARTERFSGIKDGDRLPLDTMLVYYGPAVDYLDLAVWVSRDAKGSLALGDLIEAGLTGPEVQEALAQFGEAMHATAAAMALGAGAVVINLAYKVLRRAVGDSVGLYRTSLLAQENFGIGRHPPKDMLRAQDFSFAYTVDGVS